jgi:hypothetical protein
VAVPGAARAAAGLLVRLQHQEGAQPVVAPLPVSTL